VLSYLKLSRCAIPTLYGTLRSCQGKHLAICTSFSLAVLPLSLCLERVIGDLRYQDGLHQMVNTHSTMILFLTLHPFIVCLHEMDSHLALRLMFHASIYFVLHGAKH
jgi:hypothetical protein